MSTDWPAIASAIATGVVGLAGIGGTLWSSKGRTNVENERIRLADKRQVYVRCVIAFDNLSAAASKRRYSQTDFDPQTAESVESEYATALIAASNVRAELRLIAPAEIRNLAKKILDKFAAHDDDAGQVWAQLQRAMRSDLGEPSD